MSQKEWDSKKIKQRFALSEGLTRSDETDLVMACAGWLLAAGPGAAPPSSQPRGGSAARLVRTRSGSLRRVGQRAHGEGCC